MKKLSIITLIVSLVGIILMYRNRVKELENLAMRQGYVDYVGYPADDFE